MKSLSALKKKALLASGTLNLHPEAIRSELFTMDFFDPHDRAQIKYEMLRTHAVDEQTVTEACRQFGFSRESFYEIREAFTAEGFFSLIPKKRGRKGPSKLKGAILQFVQGKKKEKPELDPARLVSMIAERYGVQTHRTTVMRALKKKRLSPTGGQAERIRRK